jgi:flagellar export protein FliJ
MARFVFRLESVLRHRRREQQQRQRDLAVCEARLAQLKQALARLGEQTQLANEDLRANRLVGRIDLSFLSAHRRFLAAMQRGALEITQRIAVAAKQVADAQAALAEAARRCKTIEKLRERHVERWRTEQSRRELSALDEVGMQIAYRNLSEELESSA